MGCGFPFATWSPHQCCRQLRSLILLIWILFAPSRIACACSAINQTCWLRLRRGIAFWSVPMRPGVRAASNPFQLSFHRRLQRCFLLVVCRASLRYRSLNPCHHLCPTQASESALFCLPNAKAIVHFRIGRGADRKPMSCYRYHG